MGIIRSSVVRLSKVLSRQGIYPFLEEQFGRIPEGASVLNVGAGGEFGVRLEAHARSRPFDVLSIDVDAGRGPDITGDIAEYDFQGRTFDAVVMAEVLEHVTAPDQAIQAVHRALTPGGGLILTTPFLFPLHDRPDDYYRFTRYGLEWLLREFSEVTIAERNSWAEAINVLWVRLIKEKNPGLRLAGPLIVGLGLAFWPVAWALGRLIKTDFLTSGYLVLARK